ncbi:hypothetical protein V5N11_030344 [Cardamine amara subsp. amara]|uniref:Uncharacterized protein n=1 Tax=Cardamine amara subsp. amara TaxID=228776 RepID=A0ABD1AX29_CARAN
MPLSVAKRLGLMVFKPHKISLILVDRSIHRPEGLLENVPVWIGECIIYTDFIVLKLEEEPRDLIILGRPFLAITGAIMNVQKRIIKIHLSDLVMRFDLDKMNKRPVSDNQTFWVDTLDEITQAIMHKMHSQYPLKVAIIQAESEYGYCRLDTTGFARIVDSADPVKKVFLF